MKNSKKEMPDIWQARQSFITGGRLQRGVVTDAIERSWQRCFARGLNAQLPDTPEVITARELSERLEKNRLLLGHAEPEMLTLSEQIAHTRSMVILTDAEGIILHRLGDQSFLDDAGRIALAPGASWNEMHRGTNAIGTALIEQVPISVQGAEHYMAYHHALSCAAVPIFGPHNELLATLDVSNDLSLPQQHTLALVKMAAQMIENRMFNASFEADIALHFHARQEFIGTLWEGIAIFQEDGQFVAMNRSAQFQLNLGRDDLQIPGGALHFNQLFDLPLHRIFEKLHGTDQSPVFSLHFANGARVYACLTMTGRRLKAQPAINQTTVAIRPANLGSPANLELLNSGDAGVAKAIRQVKQVLNRDIPILILGETGAGKDLFARAIHEASPRCSGPWVAVNCAALPEGLIESELFGYEEGAFTGARRKGSAGKLEQASGGTLFLDEIGDMPLVLQARLLRVLQDRAVTPLGSRKVIPLDFMLISATNHKIGEKVSSGAFRSDLYYRLNGLSVHLPSLRERTDMEALIRIILQIERATDAQISNEVLAMFRQHPWPGNIRQLHNVLRIALALADGEVITLEHLPQDFIEEMRLHHAAAASMKKADSALEGMEQAAIRLAMQQHHGNISAVSRQLGISRNTLYRKLKTQGLG